MNYNIDRKEYEEHYGEEVGTCNIHKIMVVDRDCPECEDEQDGVCEECGEYRPDDARVDNGLKCGQCAYVWQGGE